MTRIGFTGTQQGMQPGQSNLVRSWITMLNGTDFHHGDCVGADHEAHQLALAFGCAIRIHPPDSKRKRAFCSPGTLAEPKPYLERNKDIVNASEVLIAAPGGMNEQRRSGTWATVRFARKAGIPIVICFPNGGWRAEYQGRSMEMTDLLRVV